jgi:tetratricopeptide (TPR) repeat protein
MKRLRILFLFTILLLAGCVNMKQEVWLHSDGSGTVYMDVAIKLNAPSGIQHPFAKVKDLDKVDSNIQNIKLDERRDGEHIRYTLEFDVLDWHAFAESPHEDLFPVQLEQLANGNWRWTQRVQREPDTKRAEDEIFLQGEFFDITIHAPNVVSTDGEIVETSGPQSTMHWRIPVTDMLIHGTDSVQTIEYAPFTQNVSNGNNETTGSQTSEEDSALPAAVTTDNASAFATITEREATLIETFDTYNGRWQTVDRDDRTMRLSRGLYELTLNVPELITWQSGAIVASDFVLAVDTVFLDGPQSGGADILFRFVDDNNFYELSLYSNGRYGLYALVNGEWKTLVKATQSAAIRTGNKAHNQVEIFAQGKTISVAVNGVLLFTHEDTLFESGDIALGLFTNDEAGVKIGFETLKLWNLKALRLAASGDDTLLTDESADTLIKLGADYFLRGHFTDVLKIFAEVLKREPKNVEALAYRAVTYAMLGESRKANTELSKAIEIDPEFPLAWHAQALLYIFAEDSVQALRSANRALELDPEFARAHLARALVYQTEGDMRKALSELDRAIQLEPQNEGFYTTRGGIYHADGDDFAALSDYLTALEINPESPSIYIGMGDAYFAREEYWEALASYNKSISLNATDAAGYIGRGDLFRLKLEEYDAAVASYTEAITLDSADAYPYFARGLARKQQNDFFAALDDFDQALTIAPNYAEVYIFRGDLYKQLGQIPTAYTDYQQYLELDQSRSEAARYACEQVNALQPLAAAGRGDVVGLLLGAVVPLPLVCNRF